MSEADSPCCILDGQLKVYCFEIQCMYDTLPSMLTVAALRVMYHTSTVFRGNKLIFTMTVVVNIYWSTLISHILKTKRYAKK